MKARVKFTYKSRYDEYDEGDIGIVDGYCRGGNDIPCAIVMLETGKRKGRFVLADTMAMMFIEWVKED